VTGPLNNVIPVLTNSSFIVNDGVVGLAPGKYKLKYALNPIPTGSCDKDNEVVLTVIEEKTAVIMQSELVCNVDKGNNENILDFRNFILNNTWAGGTWSKPANFTGNFSDFTNVDFKGLPIGAKYVFTYTINNAAPCEDHEYKITIEVIDCACPPIKTLAPKDVCASEGIVDLAQYNDPTNPGDWSSTELTIVNNKVDVSLLASGNYKIVYTVKNITVGCPSTQEQVLTVVKPKNAGAPIDLEICNNEPESIKLLDLLNGEDTGGKWKEVSLKPSSGNAFNANSGLFNTANQAAGTYIFEYSFVNQSPCPSVIENVTIEVISAPTAQAGNPSILDCAKADASIGDPTDNQPNVTYEWVHDGGQIVPNADKATTQVNFPGKFTITVTNTSTGCSATDDVIVSVDPNKPIAEIDNKNVSCANAKDGSISFVNIVGGKAPLQFSKDGGLTFQSTPNFSGLNGGTYNMIIKDATGCTFIKEVIITEPVPYSIDLGNDTTIVLGQQVLMDLTGQIPAGAKSIKWTATDTSGLKIVCEQPFDQCITYTSAPVSSTTVCAMVLDNNGCPAEDCKVINLLKARNIVFSNIIQSDNGGENNFFYPESSSVGWINDMRIYDRWGNLMFERKDFAANDRSLGWSGKFNGKDVVPGVYTWVIKLEYDKKGSGDFEVFSGDVTVIK
jgi:hypothetical protein